MVQPRAFARRLLGVSEMLFRSVFLFCLVWIAADCRDHPVNADDPDAFFDQQIAPLLARRCLQCHNATERRGGLDLSSADSARQGGESGAAFVPGDRDESLLWQRIQRGEMPPEDRLPDDEKALLGRWIAEGAPWGRSPIDLLRFTTDSRAGFDN